jgi:putative endopeptidase
MLITRGPRGALLALLVACVTTRARAQAQRATPALGIDTTGMDRSVRPQDDFFRFVNGRWADRTQIPPDQSSYGSFTMLRDKSLNAVRGIVEEAAAQQAPGGSVTQQVGDFYRSFMDTTRIETQGLQPLHAELASIAKISSASELPAALARLDAIGVGTVLGTRVGQDQKNSSAYIVTIGQSRLGLPDRDYYLRQDEKFAAIRKAYADYIARLFTLANQADPNVAAQHILALETSIAEKQWARARMRDRDATYNKMTVSELCAKAPGFAWQPYLAALGGKEVADIVVRQPDYMQAVATIFSDTPVSTWREYLTFNLLNSYADELPEAFVDAKFDFSGRVLAGEQEIRPRWKRGVTEVERALGEPIGKLYVARYFTPDAKARMDALVKNILAAFKIGIDERQWMSPATKAQAQQKLAKFTVKIGYPDHWRDYSGLAVSAADLVDNVMRSNRFQNAENWSHLGKPVERWRWGMTPQTVNAYYNPTNNEIVFPAAILQPPFFNKEADDAVNYGAIGAVIGHEASHGFDDQGRKSDGDGNLRDWWTPDDSRAFEARTAKLGAEYESYEPLVGMHINGKLTMGENIGDLSGLAVAYRAYHLSLQGKPAPVIGGFTGDQRFFMGFAQVWRFKVRDEALRNQLLTDPHSPGMYRAFVPLTNIDAFYQAFDVQPSDKLYRALDDRVKIW